MNTKIVVRRIGVISLAKIQGVLYALLGLLYGAVFSLIAMMGAAFMNAAGSSSSNAFGMLFGVGSIIIFPIFFGIFGFIAGLIIGALYNLVAGMVGGLELDGIQTQAQQIQ
jgi:hypothetical protein